MPPPVAAPSLTRVIVQKTHRPSLTTMTLPHGVGLVGRAWCHPERQPTYFDRLETVPLRKTADVLPATVRSVPEDVSRVRRLALGPLQHYSLQEIQRLLQTVRPDLTREYFDKKLAPHLKDLHRTVDRFGAEPNYLFAAHLAEFLRSLPNGTTEQDAVEAFLREPRESPLFLWPNFQFDDVDRLRKLYPFIPRWEGGRKRTGDTTPIEERERTAALARVPLFDSSLEELAALREESGRMENVHLVEATGVFEDLAPRLELMLSVDRLRGRDITLVAKHYSSDPLLVDVFRRVYGVNIQVVTGDDEVAERVKRAVSSAARANDGTPDFRLAVHVEGVFDLWKWVADFKHAHPELKMVGVSHTTSDGHDLLRTVGSKPELPIVLMSLSDAKAQDEAERFRLSFTRLVYDLGDALNEPVFSRPALVLGYGGIVGPAIAEVLKQFRVNVVVYDQDPVRREAARVAGYEVIDSLDQFSRFYAESVPTIFSAAGAQTLSGTDFDRFPYGATLVSLGSGRREFDMEALEERARQLPEVNRRTLGTLGHQPIVEYQVETAEGRARFAAVADGYVANLAFSRPMIPAYSMTTPMLVWESLRQALFDLDQGVQGVHPLRTIQMEVASQGHRKVIDLFPRWANTRPTEWMKRHFELSLPVWLPGPFMFEKRSARSDLGPGRLSLPPSRVSRDLP